MVFDILLSVMIDISSALFSWLGAPEMFEQPLISEFYSSIVFLAAFFLVPIASLFLGKKRKMMMFSAGFAVSLLFGSLYLALFSLILQSALLFVLWFRFKREREFGDIDEPKFDEEPELDEPKFDDEAATPSFEEPSAPATPSVPPQPQYSCPTCGAVVTYIPQYQRYYCYTCQKYV
ncbi:MAG: hypothetical protein KAT35_03130 [Candidatus Aenigmarchaeota archaeon]|nr:hypothetical protein [Candidatus Aenigmarchaeota archaeon]